MVLHKLHVDPEKLLARKHYEMRLQERYDPEYAQILQDEEDLSSNSNNATNFLGRKITRRNILNIHKAKNLNRDELRCYKKIQEWYLSGRLGRKPTCGGRRTKKYRKQRRSVRRKNRKGD